MIDITQLSSLITALRNETQSEAITPEMVGSLLQRIIDLLATAETSTEIKAVKDWYAKAKSFYAIRKIATGSSDRNNVYLSPTSADTNGALNTESDGIIIRQATTDRAGAMRAQQVIDLNAATKNVAALQTALNTLSETVAKLGNTTAEIAEHVECEILNQELYLRGAKKMMDKGYVPYLFRFTSRSNRSCQGMKDGKPFFKNPRTSKGWHRMGAHLALKIQSDEKVLFNTEEHMFWHCLRYSSQFANNYSPEAKYLVNKRKTSNTRIGWGNKTISLLDYKKYEKRRLVKLRFGIAFLKKQTSARQPVTLDMFASNIAEFHIVHYRISDVGLWNFTK